MTCLFDCGYVRANIIRGIRDIHASQIQNRHSTFISQFKLVISQEDTLSNSSYFNRKSKEFSCFLRKKGWKGSVRDTYIKRFTLEKWNKKSDNEKSKHTVKACKVCQRNHGKVQLSFPNVVTKNEKRTPLKSINKHANNKALTFQAEIPIVDEANPAYLKEAGKLVWKDVNTQWSSIFKTPLTNILPKIAEIIEKKK